MKYRRLSKEQFEALHEAFSQFLASQSIDQHKWADLKAAESEFIDRQLDAFSDLVWEATLRKTVYIDHLSPGAYFGFHAGQQSLRMVGVKLPLDLDFNAPETWQWLETHWEDQGVSFYMDQKPYARPRTEILFELIEKGGVLAESDNFERLSKSFPS